MARQIINQQSEGDEIRVHYENLQRENAELKLQLQASQQALTQLTQKYESSQQLIEELHIEHLRLKVLVDHAPVGIVMADADGVFLITNREAEATVGGKITGNASGPNGGYSLHYSDGSLIPPEELPMVRAQHRGEIVKDYEMMVRRIDGQEVYLLVHAAPVVNSRPEIHGSIAVLKDITARKRADAERERLISENHRQKTLLDKVIQAVPVAIAVLEGPSHRYVLANPMQYNLTRGKGEILGKTVAEIWPEAAEQVLPILDRVFQTGEAFHARNIPFDMIRDQGLEQAFFNVSYLPLLDEAGQVEGILALAVETTEDMLVHRQVENERNRLEAVLQSLPVGVWIADQNGQLIGKNEQADQIWAGEAPLSETIDEYPRYVAWYSDSGKLLRPEEYPVARVLHTGQAVEPVELNIRRFDGTEGTILVSAAPIQDRQGALQGVVGVNLDITDQKKAEESLHVSEHRLRTLVEANIIGIMYRTVEGEILEANDAFLNLMGCTRQELEEGKIHAREITPVEYHLLDEEKMAETIRSGSCMPYEKEYIRTDGSRVPVLVGFALLVQSEQLLVAFVLDLSQLKRTEAELQEYARQLEQSNQELVNFAYIASHDLKEPLRKIIAFGKMLAEKNPEGLDEEGQDFLRRMIDGSRRMQNMTNALLEMSRVHTHGRPFVLVDLDEVALTVVSDLESRIKAVEGHVSVTALPTIKADPVQMQQLLQNLIGNALKYHRHGVSPRVHIHAEQIRKEEGGPPDAVKIYVSDNGIGFNEIYLERIFQPFQRLVGHSQFEGYGMGLAICKKIVDRHSGTITARSNPGQGSTFVVTLPISGD